MLAAVAEGLSCCPMASLVKYPDILRDTLGIPEDRRLLTGIAVGWGDQGHPVNGYRTARAEVDDFVRFLS